MSVGLTRIDLRENAQAKLDDAMLLLKHRRFSNAYYLAGYGVEMGLKAIIARQLTAETIPPKDILRGVLDHNFERLVYLAGLSEKLDLESMNVDFGPNWGIVRRWSPDRRYESNDAAAAQKLIRAIIRPESGVLRWIKAYW